MIIHGTLLRSLSLLILTDYRPVAANGAATREDLQTVRRAVPTELLRQAQNGIDRLCKHSRETRRRLRVGLRPLALEFKGRGGLARRRELDL